jgi:hypothetical protein
MKSDTELDSADRRHIGIRFGHAALLLGRANASVNHTGKFDRETITNRYDDAATVFGNLQVNKLRPD